MPSPLACSDEAAVLEGQIVRDMRKASSQWSARSWDPGQQPPRNWILPTGTQAWEQMLSHASIRWARTWLTLDGRLGRSWSKAKLSHSRPTNSEILNACYLKPLSGVNCCTVIQNEHTHICAFRTFRFSRVIPEKSDEGEPPVSFVRKTREQMFNHQTVSFPCRENVL